MLVTPQSTLTYAKREAGGKGFNLYLLTQEGFHVPKWLVLPAKAFQLFVKKSGLDAKLQAMVSRIQDGTLSCDDAEREIESLFAAAAMPAELETMIRQAYRSLQSSLIAVRSSAADEDSAKHSFAGQLSSYLYVTSEEETIARIKQCWASGFSSRGLSYRIQNKIPLEGIRVAVVLQEMVDSQKSGVVFTCDPIQGNQNLLTINGVYGVGEGFVSGLLDADMFSVDKKTLSLVSSEVTEKSAKLIRATDRTQKETTLEVPVPAELQNVPLLDAEELKKLSELALAIEKFYRFPQDIEWGYRDGKFYVLQSRPVTTPVKAQEGTLFIWDNSNIVESYGGMTRPLTFTFAHHVYHSVYVQFCEILLIPTHEIRKMDYFLRNMLGIFNGRIYYNLLNWYKLTSILPGFKYNRQFMETMMGTAQGLADEIADRIKPPGFQEKFGSKVRRFITGLKFVYFHLTIQSVVDEFMDYFHIVYGEFRKRDYSRMPADEIWRYYQEMENRLLLEWKAPIINDYLCMVHFGVLKKLTGLWLSSLGDSLQNDLLCGEGNLESAEPTRELIRMAQLIQKDPALRQLIESAAAEDCMEAIHQSAFAEFKARVQRYIDLYGFRCMNEMKLEEQDLYQDPTFLFVCLKNYLRNGQTDLEAYEKREKEIRQGAEAKVHRALSGIKLRIYLWSLKHARKAVKNRENTRFCRTRIYGVVRAMFYGIGRDYTARDMIEQPEDVFFLTLPELSGALEGTLPVYSLKEFIALRKSAYATYEPQETAPRFHTRGPTYWMNDFNPQEETDPNAPAEELPPNALKGIGCCPGVIEGKIKVVLSPKDDMELNKEILVTLRTDPGWIPLYPSASALLVERGGLLSHSAIVAREMGLPTVVGVKGLTQKLKSGMRVRINGETGMIEILSEETSS